MLPSSPAQLLLCFFHHSGVWLPDQPLIRSTMLPRQSRALTRDHSTGSNSPKVDFALLFLSSSEGASGNNVVLEQPREAFIHVLERPVHTVHIY
ncbi:hypothetical protein SORBI_3004G346800 [Sorghum bicolor]|uniref:Uncharacterized protein n=1 Tax=Sorghum bicolor TaxID=4558 RepID=A0A194YT61_SORBI|nr:hypothetical protein SORBI_3004G346800 [Sorghum bicolor]